MTINEEKCKGCGLCIKACPHNNLGVKKKSNQNGYYPPFNKNKKCTDCGKCFQVCPDVAIKIGEEI